MTYEEIIAFALEHYDEGGDCLYECLSRSDYEREVAEGYGDWYTEENMLRMFATYNSVFDDIKGA